MASEAVENYLKAMYALQHPQEGAPQQVSIGELAAAVGVTPGTATTMVKKLAAQRLARYERYGGVALSPKGARLALAVLRRHRLVETFLVHTLGMDWGEVHAEAERLEHALSDRLLQRLDEFLGHPAVDPHGDPIPDADGRVRELSLVALSTCAPGTKARVSRVLDQSHDFLRFVDAHGLRPGAVVQVVSLERGAGTIAVHTITGGAVTLSLDAAARMLVQRGVTRGSGAAPDPPPSPSPVRRVRRRGTR